MRKLATVCKVDKIKSIPGADLIELAIIGGWQVVIRKGDFKPGDLGVYFEIDSFLPIEKRYEFLRQSSYKKIEGQVPGKRSEGYRLRTIKLRGQISQGLLLPCKDFPEMPYPHEGTDVTRLLNIELYEPPVPANLKGIIKGKFPGFIHKTEQERIQNLLEYFDLYKDVPFECTEKLDGTSMTAYFNNGEFGICSRNWELIEDDKSLYWKIARELKLEEALKKLNLNVAWQGEIIGEGIQKNPYRIKGQRFCLFDIWDINKKRYMTYDERFMSIFIAINNTVLGLGHVPIIEKKINIFQHCKDIESLLEYANYKSYVNFKRQREGIVFKSLMPVSGQIISFKVVNNEYLLKEEK